MHAAALLSASRGLPVCILLCQLDEAREALATAEGERSTLAAQLAQRTREVGELTTALQQTILEQKAGAEMTKSWKK